MKFCNDGDICLGFFEKGIFLEGLFIPLEENFFVLVEQITDSKWLKKTKKVKTKEEMMNTSEFKKSSSKDLKQMHGFFAVENSN